MDNLTRNLYNTKCKHGTQCKNCKGYEKYKDDSTEWCETCETYQIIKEYSKTYEVFERCLQYLEEGTNTFEWENCKKR